MPDQPPRPSAIEAVLVELIPRLASPSDSHGRTDILSGALLWTALLSQTGLWDFLRVPAGDARLLPDKLIAAFDVRRQQFHTVQTSELPRQNENVHASCVARVRYRDRFESGAQLHDY